MKTRNCISYSSTACWLIIMSCGSLSNAQEDVEASIDAGFERIQVTANRRIQDLQDVSSFITVIDETIIERASIMDISDIEILSAGLRMSRSGDELRPAMRGARTNEVGVAGTGIAEQIVGIFVDDVYVPSTTSALDSLVDINRIEVLRGPQGTLYGRNTFAGSINVISNKPVLGELTGSAKIALGNYHYRQIQAIGNIPISEHIAGRIVFVNEERDGLIENLNKSGTEDDLREKNNLLLRLTTLWKSSEAFEASFRLQYSDKDANSDGIWGYQQIAGYQITETTPGSGQFLPNAVVSHNHIYQPENANAVDESAYKVHRNAISFSKHNHLTANLLLKVFMDKIDIHWISSLDNFSSQQFYDNDYSNGGFDTFGGFGRQDDQKTLSSELKVLNHHNELFSWTAGLYLYEQEADWEWLWREDQDNDGLPDTIVVPSWGNPNHDPHTVESQAIYAQATFSYSDSTRMILGGRFQKDQKDFTGSSIASWKDTAFLYKTALEYDLNTEQMVYASIASGYRTGGVNDLRVVSLGAPGHYENEQVTSFELGINNAFHMQKLRLNLAVFSNSYDDVKAQLFAVACNDSDSSLTVLECVKASQATTFEYYENGGEVNAMGLELDLSWQPDDELSFSMTAAWLDAKFGNGFSVGSNELKPYLGLGNLENRQNINNPESRFHYDGWKPGFSPKLNISLSSLYQIELESYGIVSSFVTVNYIDDYFAFDTNIPETLVDSHYIINAQVHWEPSSNWKISLNIDNLTDKSVMTRSVVHSQLVNGLPANSVQANWNDPRTYEIRLHYLF